MCPVQWRPATRPKNGLRFLRVIGEVAVTTLEHPADYVRLALHWQEERGQSFPCMGEGQCNLCPGGVKVHCYTVALAWDYAAKRWDNVIADLGHPDSDLVAADLRGKIAYIHREKFKDRRSNLVLREIRTPNAGTPMPALVPVDVRPHLMRRYGLFREADYFAARPYVEQETLKFPLPGNDSQAAS